MSKLKCSIVQNICKILPETQLKNILIDSSYLEEKLNLFIWAILAFEPKFEDEFVDSDILSAELKCKKIIECLSVMGAIDPVDFQKEKLLSTSIKNYKEILLILNDLCEMILQKANSTQQNNSAPKQIDISFQTPKVASHRNLEQTQSDLEFAKITQIFDDPTYLKEFRYMLYQLSSSTAGGPIPSDLQKAIRTINESSAYLDYSYQMVRNAKKEDLMAILESKRKSVLTELAKHSNALIGEIKEGEPIDLSEDQNKFNNLNSRFESHLSELCLSLNEFMSSFETKLSKEATNGSSDKTYGSSDLGARFYELSQLSQSFKSISKYFKDWSTFIFKQMGKHNEYEEKCELFHNGNIQKLFAEYEELEANFSHCLSLLGCNSILTDGATITKSIERILS